MSRHAMSSDGWKFLATVVVLSWLSFRIALQVIVGPGPQGTFPSTVDFFALLGGLIFYLPIWFGLVLLLKPDEVGELMVPRNERAVGVHLLAALGTIGGVVLLQFLEVFG